VRRCKKCGAIGGPDSHAKEVERFINPTTTTNALKKGVQIQRRDGCMVKMMDNKRGNLRVIKIMEHPANANTVVGDMGANYAHDFIKALIENVWHTIVLTAKQQDIRKIVSQALEW